MLSYLPHGSANCSPRKHAQGHAERSQMEKLSHPNKPRSEALGALIHRMRTLAEQARATKTLVMQLEENAGSGNRAKLTDAKEGCEQAAKILDSNAANLHSLMPAPKGARKKPVSHK